MIDLSTNPSLCHKPFKGCWWFVVVMWIMWLNLRFLTPMMKKRTCAHENQLLHTWSNYCARTEGKEELPYQWIWRMKIFLSQVKKRPRVECVYNELEVYFWFIELSNFSCCHRQTEVNYLEYLDLMFTSFYKGKNNGLRNIPILINWNRSNPDMLTNQRDLI